MNRFLLVLGVFGALWLCDPAVAQEEDEGLGAVVDRTQAAPPPIEANSEDDPARVLEALVETLPLPIRIAQLMLVTLQGVTQPNNTDRLLIKDFPPGGVIIPRINRPQDAADYIKVLRSSAVEREEGLPLLIATNFFELKRDQTRPLELYLKIPAMLTWAAGGVCDATQGLIQIMARDLRTMGFNMHLGPSLELASEMQTGAGNVYNFGSDPDFISSMADQIGSAMADSELIWLPMGFPGGGENRGERGPPVLLTPKSQLRSRDLLPYERAVKAGAEMIHVGNTLVPTLDKGTPASLSPIVVRQVLRDILDFDGLVVAGPIDAPEMSLGHNSSGAAILALQAGADMLYWSDAGTKVIKAIGAITLAVMNGTLEESIVNDAFERIVSLKQKHGLLEREKPVEKVAAKLIKEREKVLEPRQIERRAVTLIKNDDNLLPLSEERSMPIYVTGSYGVSELADAAEEYVEFILRQPIRTARHIGRIQDFEIERLEKFTKGMRTVVCVLSPDIAAAGQVRLIKFLKETGAKIVAVHLGYPAKLSIYDDADAFILAYADPSDIGQTMKAVADVLMGNAPVEILPAFRDLERRVKQQVSFDVYDVIRSPVGRMPVTVIEPYVAGYSISYRPTLEDRKILWDFGDGKKSKDPVTTHAYKDPGRYLVRLTIKDGEGDEVLGEFGVVVR